MFWNSYFDSNGGSPKGGAAFCLPFFIFYGLSVFKCVKKGEKRKILTKGIYGSKISFRNFKKIQARGL